LALSDAKKRVLERRRKAANLSVEGWRVKDIAEKLGVNEKTIDRDLKSRSARAIFGRAHTEERHQETMRIEAMNKKLNAMPLEERYVYVANLLMMEPWKVAVEFERVFKAYQQEEA